MDKEKQELEPLQPHSVDRLRERFLSRINKTQVINPSSGLGSGSVIRVSKSSISDKNKSAVCYLPGGVPIYKPVDDDQHKSEPKDEKYSKNVDLPGFYCDTCRILYKDSHSYLNHINSKVHQKAIGRSMKVEKASLDQVKEKLSNIKSISIGNIHDDQKYTHDEIIDQVKKNARKRSEIDRQEKRMRKEKNNEHELNTVEQIEEIDPIIKDMRESGFDFTGFCSTKK